MKKKFNLKTTTNKVVRGLSEHSPEILTGIGIAGFVTTVVLAVHATPKALELLDAEVDARYNETDEPEPLTMIDTVKVAWKPYIPAMITGVSSAACIIGANSVHAKRNAALAAAYQIAAATLSDYRETVIEEIGEKKEQLLQDKVAQKQVDKNPPKEEVKVDSSVRMIDDDDLCYDPKSDRYFRSSKNKIDAAVNRLNHQMTIDFNPYVSLNDFYDELGLKHTDLGDDVGWNSMGSGMVEIGYSYASSDNGRPVIVLQYLVEPQFDFTKLR